MQIQGSIALVTGANRGIGRALVQALLEAGAAKVYATARNPEQLAAVVAQGAGKIVPLRLDVTDDAAVARSAQLASDVNVLFNNAGVLASGALLSSERDALERDLATNYFGVLNMARAFAPVLERARPSAMINTLSVLSLAAMPAFGGYGASKAAASSLTQALRAELQQRGIAVHGVYPGPIDTEMAHGIDLPKTSPESTARAMVAGVAADQLDIFPDPMSESVRATWSTDPFALIRQFASL